MKDYRKLFAGIIICSSLITGCASSAPSTTVPTEAASVLTEADTATSSSSSDATPDETSMTAVSSDIQAQLDIILADYDTWVPKPDYPEDYDPALVDVAYHNDAHYAVTDLDDDGQLEITVSEYDRGSGVCSRFLVYEVTGEGDLLLLNDEPDPGFDMPDLFEMDSISYYTDEAGVRRYLAYDYTANGRYGHVYEYRRISIADGLVIENLCEEIYHGELEGDCYSYCDGEGNEISEEEFDSIYENEYASVAEGENGLGWIRGSRDDELLMPDIDMLTESYLVFTGEIA